MTLKAKLHRIMCSKSRWSELPIDPCAVILSKLSHRYMLRFKAVCRSWNKVVKHILQSSLSFTFSPELPWILLSQKISDKPLRFYTLEQNTLNITPKELFHKDSICLGSSHGWLLFMGFLEIKQEQLLRQLLLVDPFSGTQLPLPDNMTSTGYSPWDWTTNAHSIEKVVLSSRPTCGAISNKNVGVLVMHNCVTYEHPHHLSFCKLADHKWRKLSEDRKYIDVTSYDNQFYTLCQGFSVEVWDFPDSIPVQKMKIQPDASVVEKFNGFQYIIKTVEEDLFVVVKAVWRRPENCGFSVYKMVHCPDGGWRWIEVQSIGNHAVFLCWNQSMVISSFDASQLVANSIYFMDDVDKLSTFDLRNHEYREVSKLPTSYAFLFDPNPLSNCSI